MLRKLYDKTMALSASRHATPALAGISFAESSFFPIPPDLLLVPMVLSSRMRWAYFALVATVASVLGGLFGYMIGSLLYTQIAEPLLAFYGYADKFDHFIDRFKEHGAWIVFIAGITPFPYKVITIASGAAGLSLPVFILASVLARGIRFFLVAVLLYYFGPPIRDFIEKRLGLVIAAGTVLAILGYLALKVL